MSEINDLSGEAGNFRVSLTRHPRYVDLEKCIACGLCAEKCPKKVSNEYDGGLTRRKAVYVKYPQAVPLKYAIDAQNCIYLTRGKCRACEKFCPTGAIRFDQQPEVLSLQVGALIISSGSEPYDPGAHDVYGYGRSPNVLTSLEFERILSASGPTGGHLLRPSDQKEPRKIAWLQCIGSRDVHIGARGYCSAVCCTYAVKEAMLAKSHSKTPLDTAIFFMDVRTHGKDFEKYYNRAKNQSGVRFIKSKVSRLVPLPTGGACIRYVDSSGRRVDENFDMVVLSVGLGVSPEAVQLAEKLDIRLDPYHFVKTDSFEPVQTSRPGIFVCGAFEAPKDIPSSVIQSSAAAGSAGSGLTGSRWTLTRSKEIPAEVDTRGEAPRIGVFVCCCGTNIAGVVDVPAVVTYARALPYVVYAEQNMFSCAQDSQDNMAKIIKENRLNRLVVAACTPKTHEPLFQETLTNAGMNKYLFEMANIRNQCSWVHARHPDAATRKAMEVTKMAVKKVALHEALAEPVLEIKPSALIIGGGIAGLTAARTLSEQGYHAHLIEKSERLGGNALQIQETWRGEDVQENLKRIIGVVEADENIDVYLNSEITDVQGFVGNFKTTVRDADHGSRELEHGVTLIASGASEFKPEQYLYGRDERVLTGLELDRQSDRPDSGS